MSRALIVLTNDARRTEAAKWIANAQPGTRVEFKAPKRSLPQNDRMWAMLGDVSTQLVWHGQHLTSNDWKLVFLDALDKERTVPDIYGIGRVNLGRSSSDLSKEEMSELMTLIIKFGDEHGVQFHDDPIDHVAPQKMTRAEVLAKARAAKANKKAADGPSDRAVIDTAPPPKSAPEPRKAKPKPPSTTEGYVQYAQGQILANKGKVSPAVMETWFLSQHEATLRQDCKVGELATKLLHSLIVTA